jgi:chromosomal replication initiation ATPase DnaA
MPEPPRQLALDLPAQERHAAEDFLVGPSNEAAYGLIERWPDWPDTVALIVGPPGSGKTHLAAIWAGRARAWRVARADLRSEDIPHLIAPGALVVEDAQRPGDEAAFFHLLNSARLRRAFLMITADRPLEGWGLSTPDLVSRLRAAVTGRLEEPDEALLRAVLVKLFVDRQLVVDTGVVEEILVRGERSFAGARRVVEALDARSLAERRRVTRMLARQVLAQLAPADQDEPE